MTADHRAIEGSGRVLVVTDGAVDLPETLMGPETPMGPALLRRVPGGVWAGDVPFHGDVGDFWAQLRKGAYPSTTPPTVEALVQAYQHPGLVLALHVSGHLSATVLRAEEAAARAGPGVVVVDTRSLSVGAGLVVAGVCRAVESLDAPEPLISFARSLPDRLHTFALVQDVGSLRRSDRSGLLPSAHLVSNHPLVLAVRGRVVALAQPRHRSGAITELATHLRGSAGPQPGAWALGHGDASDVERVVGELSHATGKPPKFLTRLDPTVGAHLGPESIVVGAISGPIEL
jgi:fatty acid-binding protein DegV